MSTLSSLHISVWLLPFRIFLAIIFKPLVELRNRLYDFGVLKTRAIKTTVISIGNLTVGGSGKTILVQSLLKYFTDHDIKPAVLSRGYGRKTKGLFVVSDGVQILGTPETSGDEPFLISTNFPGAPVVVCEDRFIGAQHIENRFEIDVIILDDGFQHRRLFRDLDILILDQNLDFPGQHILPWGRLREGLKNRRRADLILYSKNALGEAGDNRLNFDLSATVIDYSGTHHSLEKLKGRGGLFSGLGNNEHFFNAVKSQLSEVQTTLSFPDHASYDQNDLAIIEDNACDFWITTQKDFIKLSPAFCKTNNILYIMVETIPPKALLDLLKQHFK